MKFWYFSEQKSTPIWESAFPIEYFTKTVYHLKIYIYIYIKEISMKERLIFSRNGKLRTNFRNLRIYLWERLPFKTDKCGMIDYAKRRKRIPRREQLRNF